MNDKRNEVRDVNQFVIARESNVVRVDFNREPDPPEPSFPGARGMRLCAHASETAREAVVLIFPPDMIFIPPPRTFSAGLAAA